MQNRQVARDRRHRRVRKKVRGTAARPRLAVFRSNKHIYAQVIDDVSGTHARRGVDRREVVRRRLAAPSPRRSRSASSSASAPRAPASTTVVFDRGGFRYHGRVAAVADGAREAGLKL